MYDKTLQKKIMERVAKHEEKEEEEEEVEVEVEQEEPAEPTVPPPEMVSMEIMTDESFLERGTSPIWKLFYEQKPEEKKADIQKDDTALRNEPAKRLYHGVDITELVNFPFFQMVIMVNGQGSTIKDIQLLLNINICSGMFTGRPMKITRAIGIVIPKNN